MSSLRSHLIRLAAVNPELRADLLPLLKEDANPGSLDQNKPESYYGLPPRGVQAARRREDPNRVVFMVTSAIAGPMIANVTNGNVTNGMNKKHPYDGTPEGLTSTLQEVATGAIRFQSMDFLDGPEINVVKAPRVPPGIAQSVSNRATFGDVVYVALRGTSMGLEWAILPRAPKVAGTRRKAHGPVAIRQPEVMLYAIDADASAKGQSKFYEMKVVPFGEQVDVVRPTVQKQKDFRQTGSSSQGFMLAKRWGRLTDTGSAGRVDGMNEYFDREADARAAMEDQKRKKMRGSGSAAYQDVSRSREYPIGLGGAGFGWGGQQACVYVPELRELRHAVTSMNATIAKTGPAMEGLARKNSDVGRRVTSLLGEVQSSMQNLQKYLDAQMNYCD